MPYWNHLRRRGRKIICSPPRRWPVRSLVPRELLFSAALVTVFVLLLGVVSLLPRWVILSFWMLSLLPYPGEYFVFFVLLGAVFATLPRWVFLRFIVVLGAVSLLPWWVFFCAFGCCLCYPGEYFCVFGFCLFTTRVSVFGTFGCCLWYPSEYFCVLGVLSLNKTFSLSSSPFFSFPFWISYVFFLRILFNLKRFHHHHN